jgi:hypothetical protein
MLHNFFVELTNKLKDTSGTYGYLVSYVVLPQNLWAPFGAAARSLPPSPWDFCKEIGGGAELFQQTKCLHVFQSSTFELLQKESSNHIR